MQIIAELKPFVVGDGSSLNLGGRQVTDGHVDSVQEWCLVARCFSERRTT